MALELHDTSDFFSETASRFLDNFKRNPEATQAIGQYVFGAAGLPFGGGQQQQQQQYYPAPPVQNNNQLLILGGLALVTVILLRK